MKPVLKSLEDWNAQVGDSFQYHSLGGDKPTSKVRKVSKLPDDCIYDHYLAVDGDYMVGGSSYWSLVSRAEKATEAKVGSYYNFPFKDWFTVNDMLDYMSQKQWGWRSYIFKDIIKACFRFGQKEGTTEVYDAEKIIYYGARLLMSVSNKATTRKYLQKLLDDGQFQENK